MEIVSFGGIYDKSCELIKVFCEFSAKPDSYFSKKSMNHSIKLFPDFLIYSTEANLVSNYLQHLLEVLLNI